jgi:hypothetical protein
VLIVDETLVPTRDQHAHPGTPSRQPPLASTFKDGEASPSYGKKRRPPGRRRFPRAARTGCQLLPVSLCARSWRVSSAVVPGSAPVRDAWVISSPATLLFAQAQAIINFDICPVPT